jgi:hypothetical protein
MQSTFTLFSLNNLCSTLEFPRKYVFLNYKSVERHLVHCNTTCLNTVIGERIEWRLSAVQVDLNGLQDNVIRNIAEYFNVDFLYKNIRTV